MSRFRTLNLAHSLLVFLICTVGFGPCFAQSLDKHFKLEPKCSFSYSSHNSNYLDKTLYFSIPHPCKILRTSDTNKIYGRKMDHLTVFLIGSDQGVAGLLFNENKFEFSAPSFENSWNRKVSEENMEDAFDRKFFTHFFQSGFAKLPRDGYGRFSFDEYIFIDDFDEFLEEKYKAFFDKNYKYYKMRPKQKPKRLKKKFGKSQSLLSRHLELVSGSIRWMKH